MHNRRDVANAGVAPLWPWKCRETSKLEVKNPGIEWGISRQLCQKNVVDVGK